MFKHILITLLIICIIVIIVYRRRKYDICTTIVKSPLKNSIGFKKVLFNFNQPLKYFYTTTPWTISNEGKYNYIHDMNTDEYYIIEPGYLYNVLNDNIKVYIENKNINIYSI